MTEPVPDPVSPPEVPPVEFRDPIANPDLPWVTEPEGEDPAPPPSRLAEEPHEVIADEDD